MIKNIDKDTLTETLARNTLDDIPQPKSDAKEIVGLVKNGGRINGYQLLLCVFRHIISNHKIKRSSLPTGKAIKRQTFCH